MGTKMYESELRELDENSWEQFAQDVLFHLGFSIIFGPSEGADDGVDMIVEFKGIRYLVSCKHNLKSGKNVGVNNDVDIWDRVKRHRCDGFIAFYSTGPTSSLKRKFRDLGSQGIDIIELYKSDIMNIMPTMMGCTLQKYFPRPQDISYHINDYSVYKPLQCMKCEKDILQKGNMPTSMVLLQKIENKLYLIYGCKKCVNSIPEIGWAEITQIRYIEQLLGFRELIDFYVENGNEPTAEFYKAWALFQEGVAQVLIPPGWGLWLG